MEEINTISQGGADAPHAQTAVFIKDEQGKYVFCNEACARLLRMGAAGEVVGRSARDFFNPEFADVLQQDDADALALGGGVVERRVTAKNNRCYTLRKSLLAIGGARLLVGTVDGVPPPAPKKSPEAEAESQSRRYFSAFCRDARLPLNSIIGYAQIMLEQQEPELLVEGARVIQSAARSLKTALDGAVSLIGPSGRVPELEKETFDLAASTLQIVEAYSEAAGANSVEMRLKSTPIPLVEFNGMAYKSILRQLLEHAISHTRAGWVEVGTKYCAGELELYVKDTGLILAPVAKTNAFARVALNVESVKRLAAGLGGRVTVSGDAGSGTTVSVVFQGIKESGSVQRKAFEKTQKMRTMRIEDPFRLQKRILIVDAAPINRRILTLLLASLGFKNVVSVESADKALIQLGIEEYAAVFCDLELPGMDAFEFLRRVRTLPKGKRLPVHLLSTDPTLVELGKQSGFKSVLMKPVTKDELAEVL